MILKSDMFDLESRIWTKSRIGAFFIMSQFKIPESWKNILIDELEKSYMKELFSFVAEERKTKKIYPLESDCFAALKNTACDNVKVVILGQDPYHQPGQAHGLSFSVQKGVKFPPSLRNIFKELKSDLDFVIPDDGDLTKWSQQGVLLLNSVLTVEESKAGAHQGRGWEQFTDRIIKEVSDRNQNVVFILWGAYAIKKAKLIDANKHLVLEGVHPSPLSAHRGFFGSRPFSKANEYLQTHGRSPIDWGLV